MAYVQNLEGKIDSSLSIFKLGCNGEDLEGNLEQEVRVSTRGERAGHSRFKAHLMELFFRL